jgi:hypothetical protein
LPQRWSGDSEKGETTHSMWYYLTIYFFISMAQVLINLLNQVCRSPAAHPFGIVRFGQ